MGHTVKLIAPQLARPYVRRGKNDAADAEALCEAISHPSMRFVPAKAADQQARHMDANERNPNSHVTRLVNHGPSTQGSPHFARNDEVSGQGQSLTSIPISITWSDGSP